MKENKLAETSCDNLPVCKFESNEQFWDCLRYWQSRLFLDHWLIKAVLIPKDIVLDNGDILDGKNTVIPQSRIAYIEVSQDTSEAERLIEKHCEELTLVHELLHCKYSYLGNTETTIESTEFELAEHAKLHEMARTLLIVKYDIGLDWFKNF